MNNFSMLVWYFKPIWKIQDRVQVSEPTAISTEINQNHAIPDRVQVSEPAAISTEIHWFWIGMNYCFEIINKIRQPKKQTNQQTQWQDETMTNGKNESDIMYIEEARSSVIYNFSIRNHFWIFWNFSKLLRI